jgi:hypothetical protein
MFTITTVVIYKYQRGPMQFWVQKKCTSVCITNMNLGRKNLPHKHPKIYTNIINLRSEVTWFSFHKKCMLGLKALTSTILIKYHREIL